MGRWYRRWQKGTPRRSETGGCPVSPNPLTLRREKRLAPPRCPGTSPRYAWRFRSIPCLQEGTSTELPDSGHEGDWNDDALSVLQPVPSGMRSRVWRLAFGMRPHISAATERGPAVGGLHGRRRRLAPDSPLANSTCGVGSQRWTAATLVGHQLEMPYLVRIDLAQAEPRTVAYQPIIGLDGAHVDRLARDMLGRVG
jgi:hypothetical protein